MITTAPGRHVGSWRCIHPLGWKSMTTSYDIITTTLRLALIHIIFKTLRAHTINPASFHDSVIPSHFPANTPWSLLFDYSQTHSLASIIDHGVLAGKWLGM